MTTGFSTERPWEQPWTAEMADTPPEPPPAGRWPRSKEWTFWAAVCLVCQWRSHWQPRPELAEADAAEHHVCLDGHGVAGHTAVVSTAELRQWRAVHAERPPAGAGGR